MEANAEPGARTAAKPDKADEAFERFATGDMTEEAFEAAVPQLSRLVRGYLAWARVHSGDLEDLAQEAMVRAYTCREDRTGRTGASLRSWLRVMCRNLALNSRVRRAPSPPPRDSETPHHDWDLRDALEFCMKKLREPDRTVFRLRHLRELSTREIAELYGWKVRNCEHVLARARQSLMTRLKREGYEA